MFDYILKCVAPTLTCHSVSDEVDAEPGIPRIKSVYAKHRRVSMNQDPEAGKNEPNRRSSVQSRASSSPDRKSSVASTSSSGQDRRGSVQSTGSTSSRVE